MVTTSLFMTRETVYMRSAPEGRTNGNAAGAKRGRRPGTPQA
jgi:hypothetical protein